MAKLVYSYHNKKHTTTTFHGLYQNIYNRRMFFFVDVDGDPALIEYYNRLIVYIKRPGDEYQKISNFSYAKTLLDAHNSYVQSTMQTCNKNIEIGQVMPDGSIEFMSMSDILSNAFITYKGQTF